MGCHEGLSEETQPTELAMQVANESRQFGNDCETAQTSASLGMK